jgi:hypothetical protein
MVTLSLSGDAEAQRQFAVRVLDVVHRVVWSRMGAAVGRGEETRATVETRVQEVFVALLERDAEALRSWDPDEGTTLDKCVEGLSRRRITLILAGRPVDHQSPTAWEAPRGPERDAIIARIVARLDQGETLAEDPSDLHTREPDAPLELPTQRELRVPPSEERSTAWRPTPLHIIATILVAIAVASAIAVWAG